MHSRRWVSDCTLSSSTSLRSKKVEDLFKDGVKSKSLKKNTFSRKILGYSLLLINYLWLFCMRYAVLQDDHHGLNSDQALLIEREGENTGCFTTIPSSEF